ncbi:DUF6448 family protein [Geobacter sp.]|uniref:DUF6448 family protein n=1 Tax=Geobacter sp. TaxID=46610 RepID=UPI0026162411|nr:DUF6448 family protein [Geobacter sp.]
MRKSTIVMAPLILTILAATLTLPAGSARAHCDTLDGPVIQDARIALEKGDVTPVLKWVQEKEEAKVRASFRETVAAARKGAKAKEAAEHRFFESLVKIHRAGEGAPFTGLKPAGAVEPAVAAADKALAGGSAEELVKLVTDAVANGIRQRYERVAEAYRHKDESVAAGRRYVAAYVEYTHYVELLHQDAAGQSARHGHGEAKGPGSHGETPQHHDH